jgi:hypothetical protein
MAGNLTAMIASIFSGGVTADPYYEYTTLLLPGNGTNGAQNNTFLDGSSNNFTITRNGNTTQGTFSPFSQTGWGNYFNGSSRLSSSTGNVLNWGTNNFTVEMWVYLTTTSSNMMLLEGPSNNDFQLFVESGILKAGFGGAGVSVSYTLPSTFANTWNHIAVVRSGTSTNQTALYVNGVSQSTGTWSSSGAATGFQIARTSAYTLYGYVSGVRVIQNQALTSGNFTPPTAQVTTSSVGWTGANVAGSVTGTVSLLLCTSNRFVDSSGTVSTITIGGSPTVVAFSPFNPTASWSAATNGGSGYFDGNGDYLSAASNAAFGVGSGDFTIECWIYLTSNFNSTGRGIITAAYNTNFALIGTNSGAGNKVDFYVANTVMSSGTNYISLNSWTHIACVRSSGTTKIYFNGVEVGSSASLTGTGATAAVYVGTLSHDTTGTMNGYIADARIVKGTAVYTSAFTPPTAPLTNITNTSLLLNFTNAGVYDATSKNDLETWGSAQISTAINNPFGQNTGVMAFDGTGDYLSATNISRGLEMLTGDFTIECWIRFNVVGNGQIVTGLAATNTLYWQYYSSQLAFGQNNVSSIAATNWSPSSGVWYHIAVTRSGSTVRQFVDGTQLGSNATSSASFANGPIQIGDGGAGGFNGYIQDLRITKGYARYVTGTGANAGKMVFNGTNDLALPTAAFPTL